MTDCSNKGRTGAFRFRLSWDDSGAPYSLAADRTRGRLLVALHGEPVWAEPSGAGVEWTWIELLEHLGEVWRYLVFEEDLAPTARDLDGTDDSYDQLEFLDSHDLAAGLQGIWLPNMLVVRSGSLGRVEVRQRSGGEPCQTAARVAWLSWSEIEWTLTTLGDMIAERLSAGGWQPDERARLATRRWSERTNLPVEEAAAIFLGAGSGELARIESLSKRTLVDRAATTFEPSAVLAAARFAYGSVYGKDWRVLLASVDRLARAAPAFSPRVAEISRIATAALEDCPIGTRPFAQAHRVVSAIRLQLPTVMSEDSPVDMDGLLAVLEIQVADVELTSSSLDAVALWPKEGSAAIIVNRSGQHSRGRRGRNATLAHELCHVLVDRQKALPLAEVNGGRVPEVFEQRARAFAAELLVPSTVVGRHLGDFSRRDAKAVVDAVCRRYLASREIVALQFLNKHYEDLPYDARVALLGFTRTFRG